MSRFFTRRWLMIGIGVVLSVTWVGSRFWRTARLSQLESRCRAAEQSQDWKRLFGLCDEWLELSPGNGSAIRWGLSGARATGEFRTAARFLKQLDRSDAANVELLSVLADLEFGPQRNPHAGADTCRAIVRLEPGHAASRRRLIYYQVMLRDNRAMIREVREAVATCTPDADAFVYLLAGEELRLRNAPDVLHRWLSGSARDDRLSVAMALHISVNLEGQVDAIERSLAEEARRAQESRKGILETHMANAPWHVDLRAQLLHMAVTNGDAEEVSSLLSAAPRGADEDHRYWRTRGWLFRRCGDNPEAARSFERALRLNPLDWRTRIFQADLARANADLKQSERLQQLGFEGHNLVQELLGQPDARSIPAPMLRRMADYAESCSEGEIGRQLRALASQAASATAPAAAAAGSSSR